MRISDWSSDVCSSDLEFRIGKSGIERTYDIELRCKADISEVEVNAVGRVVRELGRIDGEAGKELTVSLDIELQRFAFNRFGDQTGAAVILDVRTGGVLAMASKPSYDPNAFSRGITQEEWDLLSGDERGPLTNKAVRSEERRVGQECVSKRRYRWSPYQ